MPTPPGTWNPSRQWICCGDQSCDLCHGSGIAEGPAAEKAQEAILSALDARWRAERKEKAS